MATTTERRAFTLEHYTWLVFGEGSCGELSAILFRGRKEDQ